MEKFEQSTESHLIAEIKSEVTSLKGLLLSRFDINIYCSSHSISVEAQNLFFLSIRIVCEIELLH